MNLKYIYFIYLNQVEKILKLQLKMEFGDFLEIVSGKVRGLEKLMQIKKGDLLIFVREWEAEGKVTGGRLSAQKYIGKYKDIIGVTVTKGFYEDNKEIWKNADYPYRVNFRKEILFKGSDIPCNPKVLGNSLHEILRKLQVNGTVEKIDTSLIVKLMSLCSKE